MTNEKAHHLYGGSTAKYWSNCYGWAALLSTLPPQTVGQAALRGTALHEGVLERKTVAELKHLKDGTPVDVSYDGIPAWPIEGAGLAEDFWKTLWVNVLEEFLTGKVVYIEKKLMLFPDQDAGGTADIAVVYKTDKAKLRGVIGDCKFGYHRVEPSEEQLLFYVAALYLRYLEKGVELEEFMSFVYQPAHSEPYTEHHFTKAAVLKAVKRYEKAIAESKKPKPKFKVGEWCEWCRCQAVCQEYTKHLEKQMDLAVQDNTLPEVALLPDGTLKNIFLYGEKIENYISAIRKHIIQRFADGRPLDGLKIISGVSKRRWADEIKAEEELRAAGINPMTEKMMGLTAVEAMLKNTGKTKEEVAYIMSKITTKPPPPPKIVSNEDARPAIDIAKADMLAGIDDEIDL